MFQLLGLLFFVASVSANCVWHKVCHRDEYGHGYNCPSNEPGFRLDDKVAQEILLRRCPELFKNCKISID